MDISIRYHLLPAWLVFCLTAASVFAQGYEEGRSAYIKGDYQAAYKILRPLADAGDAEAEIGLASFDIDDT